MPSVEQRSRAEARRKFAKFNADRKRKRTDVMFQENEDGAEGVSASASRSNSDAQQRGRTSKIESRIRTLRRNRLENFSKYMLDNFFAHSLNTYCYVCERIWWSNKLRVLKKDSVAWKCAVKLGYDPTLDHFKVCGTCMKDLRRGQTPLLSTVNGFVYPKEVGLPPLSPISERLISPRLPFMSIRHVRFFEGSRKLYGQVINVPVDVDTMVRVLPRALEDDYAFNVRIKKNLLNKSSYMAGCVSKSIVKEWLRYLVETPLYKRYNVQIAPEYRDAVPGVPDTITDSPSKRVIHQVRKHCTVVPEREQRAQSGGEQIMAQIQETLFWGEDYILEMAPGQNSKPLALAFDGDAEELSFPSIYYGQPREFKLLVTPYQIAHSEIRRTDRRGVRSNHILYMAGKIMRLNVINSFNVMFRNNKDAATKDITREQLEDADFLRETMNKNESFLSCLPNSIQYWQRRKSDLFAMMRQLGKPTVFLTLSASEIHWTPLMKCIYRYQQHIPEDQEIDDMMFEEISATERAQLVNSDPVLCCLYFDRLVDCILNALKLKKGPFGEYRVIEFFRRVEFQHRGSPHAHILLWLETAPPTDETKFADGENVPKTVDLINELCTVDGSLVQSERAFQSHRHTHTCYKRNTKSCRFGAPWWPMRSTRVLLPIVGADRNEALVERYKSVREMLELMNLDEDVSFDTIESFWAANGIDSEEEYLNILRHGIPRPIVMYKRSTRDTMISPFNPTISALLNSNMDIQYIVDEYSCAAYVAEYVNKSERGFSSLHRELVQLRDMYPDMDYEDCMKEVGKRALNNIEMCGQEAAWYLLRLPMSEASRKVTFIPTQHPSERFKTKKTRKQMEADLVDLNSTDVWKKNIIDHYEERLNTLKDLTLARFVSDYDIVSKKRKRDTTLDDNLCRDGDDAAAGEIDEVDCEEELTYRKRKTMKVIKWVNFDAKSNRMNFKREMVLLFWPFKSEELDLLNEDKYLKIFDDNLEFLQSRRAEFESGLRIDEVIEIVADMREELEEADRAGVSSCNVDEDFIRQAGSERLQVNDEDIDSVQRETIVRAVKNAMSHEDFCKMVRTLNYEQRALLLELMTRIIYGGEPLQVFFSGPAGSGKTYLLRALMETVNRFTTRRNTSKCAYLACATTGKAAVNVDGTTVHSALNIPINTKEGRRISFAKLQTMRCDLTEVCTIIIDEVSMMSQSVLNTVGARLRACGKDCTNRFGGFHVVFCGDLRQLPPVRAAPVYTRPANMFQDQMLWHNLEYHELKQVMRQSDKIFSDILTKIGIGTRLEDYERALIESRFFDSAELENCPELSSAIRIFHRNEQVNNYNYKKLSADTAGMVKVSAEDYVLGCANNNQKTSTMQKLHKMEVSATGYLPKELCFVLGMPYMVTQNIDKADRIVNGSMGILKYIETIGRQNEEYVVRVWMEFEDEACGARLRIKYQQHMIAHRINSKYTPITRRELPVKMNSKIIKVKRKQFPLLPSCAQTIHKVQGGSFDMVVYDYDKSHELALVYVAMSRARSLEGLLLTNQKKDHRFRHCIKDDSRTELRNEFKRLHTKRLLTLVDICDSFIKTAKSQKEVAIGSLNVQSLNAHSVDVSSDFILRNVSVLALSETWMHGEGGVGCGDPRNDCKTIVPLNRRPVRDRENSSQCLFANRVYGAVDAEALPVDGFRCVSRTRRAVSEKKGGGGVAIYESLKSNFTACHKVDINTVKSPYGDVCCAFMKYMDKFDVEQMFCLVAFYCQPGISGQHLMDLMDEAMWRFTRGAKELQSVGRGDLHWCPIVLCGDFNYNFASDSQAGVVLDYFKNTHRLDYVSKGMGISYRGGTTIDAVFVKNTPLELMYYTLYFSTHRAILMMTKSNKKRKRNLPDSNSSGVAFLSDTSSDDNAENVSPEKIPVIKQRMLTRRRPLR